MNRYRMFTGLFTCWLVGCTDLDTEVTADEPAEAETEAATDCAVPEGYEVLSTGHIVKGDLIVGTVAEMEAACANGRTWRPEGSTASGTRGIGVTSASLRWPGGRVPYAIDPALLDPERIDAAIADWVGKTTLDLVPRAATDADFLYFTNGDRCASFVGRKGGRQDLLLSTGKAPSDIVGSSISSSDAVFTWFADGTVAAGTSTDLDDRRVPYLYSLPPGYTSSMIRGIGISKRNNADRVYVWYSDNTVSTGTSDDLDSYSAPKSFSLPPGKTISQIVEMDIARNDRVYTWFSDGTVSIGTSTDLDEYSAPVPYTSAAGQSIASLRGIGIAGSDDGVYAWYVTGQTSAGSSTDLDADRAPREFRTPGGCKTPQVIHEIGHAIGLQDEQTRCDRDDFVRIFGSNIESGKSGLFGKNCNAANEDIGAYNPTSVMHLGSYDFSRNGGPTMLLLPPSGGAVAPSTVIDMSTSSTSRVYTWWSDGFVTVGNDDDLELVNGRYQYKLPSGYEPADIVGIGIAKDNGDRVYTYYRDGKRSVGTSDDLAHYSAPAAYHLPGPHTPDDIVAIDISASDNVYAWYDDGQVSFGTSVDLAAHQGPKPFKLAAGKTVADVLGIGIANNDWVYAWYKNGQVSAGTSTDLDERRAPYAFRSRLEELAPATSLNPGDVAAVEAMY